MIVPNYTDRADPAKAGREANRDPSSAAMRAGEELNSFLTNTLDMLCIAGLDGYFKRLNPAWETTLGWTKEELLSRPFIEFVHPDDRAATLVEVERLTEGGSAIQFENRYRCKDGSWKWLQWNANRQPSQRRISAIARDVTRRRNLEDQLLEAGDREKERFGRELHDGLCQQLAGIAALSTALARKLAADSDPAAAESGEITRLLNETIDHARDLARGLDPEKLEQIGIVEALAMHAANVDAMFPASCEFESLRPSPAAPLVLDPGICTHLYRIAQEAVNNAVSHSRGRLIRIGLTCEDGTGVLTVTDDGRGIPAAVLENPDRGAGLQTMAYRSRRIGGTLEVRRRNHHGTVVICRFPLSEESIDDADPAPGK